MIKYLSYLEDKDIQKVHTKVELINALKKRALRKRSFVNVAEKFQFTQKEQSFLMGVSLRTFQRQNPSVVISFPASETAVKLAELYELGLRTFDNDAESFLVWMKTPIPAIKNQIPRDLTASSLGIDLVKEELLRIEHGVY